MNFIKTEISDVIVIEPRVFGDERGYFMEIYKEPLFKDNGIDYRFVQDNMSSSAQGVLRGLHYQMNPHAQGKLVRVLEGVVYDVAVDIRKGSPTFGQYVGVELTADNKKALWIPPGFAHGFYVMSNMAEFTYKVTDLWAPETERSIIWNDPDIGIVWPLVDNKVVLSEKDAKAPLLKDAEINYTYSLK